MPAAIGGTSRVNTLAIRAVAESGATAAQWLDTYIDSIDESINTLWLSWEGTSASYYAEQFALWARQVRGDLERYRAYPQELTQFAERYEVVDGVAQSLANEGLEEVQAMTAGAFDSLDPATRYAPSFTKITFDESETRDIWADVE